MGIAAWVVEVSDTVRMALWLLCAIGGGLILAFHFSPVRRLRIVVDDDGLEVVSGAGAHRKLFVRWSDVVGVTASKRTQTCYVDGGDPSRSVLVPGVGAAASYDIEINRNFMQQFSNMCPLTSSNTSICWKPLPKGTLQRPSNNQSLLLTWAAKVGTKRRSPV